MTLSTQPIFSRFLLALAVGVFISFQSAVSQARPTISLQEQDALKRIMYELSAANELLQEAQRNADKQDRFRFSYRCLVMDINLIKKGLLTAIHGTQNRAFQNQELCIDYGYAGVVGGENHRLQQYIQELQSVLALVNESSLHRNKRLRAQFNYQILRSDLETVIAGIQRALIGSGEQLRTFPPLRGKFSQ